MSVLEDAVEVSIAEDLDEFSVLSGKPVTPAPPANIVAGAVIAHLHGFASDDRPLLTDVPGLSGEVVVARHTVPLLQEQIGSAVVVLFDQGDVHRPIVVGVLEERRGVRSCAVQDASNSPLQVSVHADDQRLTLSAEREIVLQCGHASITLTRAGKVIIKGSYVVSQSTGYNRIKGAAVDIN
jgi:hypothetical protein